MIWIKACPRCQGDLIESADIYGKYVACLQCGREITAAPRVTSAWSLDQQDSPTEQAELVAA